MHRAGACLVASLVPAAAFAVCTCGFGDGQFTLATITLDGDLADWAAIHADPDNNVCDGPSGGLTDRDAPVQSVGRDLTHFAYTWDDDNVYLFTERSGTSVNVQSFVYYADTDNDGLMETGEPVIGVSWQGSNAEIRVYTFTYISLAPAGDPVVDGSGLGDGYTLPGSFADVPPTGNPTRSGAWGSADGQKMEFFVTWPELGIAAGTPFSFHVASSNAALGAASFTAQVDDNLSGCGGGPGSTIVPGVTLENDVSLSVYAGENAISSHILTNTGNWDDVFNLSAVASGDFPPSVTYYFDSDGSSTLTGADTLMTDTDANGQPDTGELAAGQALPILVVYAVPANVSPAQTAVVSITASSGFEPAANDFVTATLTVALPPALSVAKNVTTISDPLNGTINPKAVPGAEVEYIVTLTNQGAGTVDDNSLSLNDVIDTGSCLKVTDLAAPGSGPIHFEEGTPPSNLAYTFSGLASTADSLEFSSDGGFSYSYSPSAGPSGCDPAVTDIRINPGGQFAADSGAGSPTARFIFRVIVN